MVTDRGSAASLGGDEIVGAIEEDGAMRVFDKTLRAPRGGLRLVEGDTGGLDNAESRPRLSREVVLDCGSWPM